MKTIEIQEKIVRILNLCQKAGIKPEDFLRDVEDDLKTRVKNLLTPNKEWFKNGANFNKYWVFVEKITSNKWTYEEVEPWHKMLRSPSETREEISPSLRYEVLTRDSSTCQKCGNKAPAVTLEVDHIIPWNCGGPTVKDNLRTLCKECNAGKADKIF